MSWHSCYSTPLEVHAHIIKGYLENFGVPCILDSDRFGMKPLTFGALGEIRVLVRDDWADVAAGLLRGRENPSENSFAAAGSGEDESNRGAGTVARRTALRPPWRLLRGGKK